MTLYLNKQDIYDFLDSRGISYEVTNHKAVFNMAEMAEVEMPYPEGDAKNLFVRDDKKSRYYLITVRGERRVDLKEFQKAHGLRRLSFASSEDLLSILKLTPGSVTPLGLLNDEERRVEFYLDADLADGMIGCHPNDNTASIWLKARDLIAIISEHGNPIHIVDL